MLPCADFACRFQADLEVEKKEKARIAAEREAEKKRATKAANKLARGEQLGKREQVEAETRVGKEAELKAALCVTAPPLEPVSLRAPCKNLCGFFGRDDTEGYCSQCFFAAATAPASSSPKMERLQLRLVSLLEHELGFGRSDARKYASSSSLLDLVGGGNLEEALSRVTPNQLLSYGLSVEHAEQVLMWQAERASLSSARKFHTQLDPAQGKHIPLMLILYSP